MESNPTHPANCHVCGRDHTITGKRVFNAATLADGRIIASCGKHSGAEIRKAYNALHTSR